MSVQTPYGRLVELCEERASGELVVTTDDHGEIHVFVQRGRVAWATHGAAGSLLSLLTRSIGVDRDALREVLAECQRTGASFGGTLVAWGLAEMETVRVALQTHIGSTIQELARQPHASRWVFLVRGERYASYDATLTFRLEELVGGKSSRRDSLSLRPLDARMREAVPGLYSARLVLQSEAPMAVRAATHAGVDFWACRSSERVWMGMLVDESHALLVEAPRELPLITIMQAYTEVLRNPAVAVSTTDVSPAVTERPLPPWSGPLSVLLERFDELEAVCVQSSDRSLHVAARGGLHPRQFSELVGGVGDLAYADRWAAGGTGTTSFVLGRHGLWIFGAPVLDGMTAWLVLRRSRPQAIGWSILARMARTSLRPLLAGGGSVDI